MEDQDKQKEQSDDQQKADKVSVGPVTMTKPTLTVTEN